jgi:peptidoglycan/LPS O-acetylase OafA/YrhL
MTQRYHILDFYRFLAATMVMCFHIIPNFRNNYGAFNLYVDFFFMLSGFVIFVSYEKRLETKEDYKQFLWSRLARIYPLHLLTMLLTILLGVLVTSGILKHANPDKFAITNLWQNLTLTHAWGFSDRLSLNTPSWSISAEWAMYLLTPAIFMLSRFFGKNAIVSLALIIIIAAYTSNPDWLESTYEFGAMRAMPSFLIGIYVADIHAKKIINLPLIPMGILLFCLSALLIYLNVPRLYVLLTFALTLYVTACGEISGEKSWLINPICGKLGDASYSIYMLHMLCWFAVNQALKNYLPPLLLAWTIMGFTVLVSLFSYHYFEKPAQTYLRGLYIWINVTHAAEYFSRILKRAK